MSERERSFHTYVERARALGYRVDLRIEAFAQPDGSLSMPSIYMVSGHGLSSLMREDDLEGWAGLVSREQQVRRLRAQRGAGLSLGAPAPPDVAGPVAPGAPPGDPSRDYPQMATPLDLESAGYVEEEYFLDGDASSYLTPELQDGLHVSAGHRYRTRMIVRRPLDPARFNGTAIVEWLNVSNFANVDQLWLEVGRYLLPRGYAYVGVSVQRLGVHSPQTGLRAWCPRRYGSLDLTDGGTIVDDSLCYDVYSQAALAVRGKASVKPLGPLTPELVLAYGGSQSGMRVRLYYNSVHRYARVFDGFMVALAAGRVRSDVEAPVFRIWTETEIMREAAPTRQPDSDTLRTWEVAGASHLSYRMATSREPLVARGDIPGMPWELARRPPLSRIPWGHPLIAGLEQLGTWVRSGPAPPSAPRIELLGNAGDGPIVARDRQGNALGGLRLSQHEVATACNMGLNAGPGWARLWGTHEPFDEETLRSLYASRGDYVERVRRVDRQNLAVGYIAEDAVAENVLAAEQQAIGR